MVVPDSTEHNHQLPAQTSPPPGTGLATEILPETNAGQPESQERFLDEDRLHQGLQKLSARSRSILHLRFLEDFSIEEVAGILGIRPGTVKSRTNRAMRQLKKVMEQLS
jgi:RNA polymerase sigma-70 factor (ECF subfamily)